jgi:hypothetical protein
MVKDRGKRIFRHPEGPEPDFPVNDFSPGVREGDSAVPKGFYLRAQQFYTAFIRVIDRIIVPGLAVDGDNLYPLDRKSVV